MSLREERLASLSARALEERQELAREVEQMRRRIDEKRRRFASIGFWAGTLAAGATSAYRLFGRNSLSARLDRWGTGTSILVWALRLFFRLFR
jgi:hypothetical protein